MATQLTLGIGWADAPDLDGYVAGGNAAALDSVRRQATATAGPVWLHGADGLGKTHLLRAATRVAHDAGRDARYLPLAAYADGPPDVLDGVTGEFLAVDDVDNVCGDPRWAMPLLRLIDAQRVTGGGLLLATRAAPEALPSTTPVDLRTRLQACARFALQPLDEAALASVLRQRAAMHGLVLDDGVADYLLRRLPRALPALLQALDALDRASLSAQRRLTVPFVQQTLFATPAPAPPSARTG